MSRAQTAKSKATFGDHLIYMVQDHRRLMRILFPSPAEVKFVQVMRGHALTFPFIKSIRTGFPLTLLWRGRLLKNELIEREVWVDRKFCLDFATPNSRVLKAIEIDGERYHKDKFAQQQRDQYLRSRGYDVMHILTTKLRDEPRQVYIDVLKFLKT